MPIPPPPPDAFGSIEAFLRNEIRTLELLFADEGLARLRRRSPTHPAIVRYDLMVGFAEKRVSLTYPNEVDVVLAIGGIVLDILSLPQAPQDLINALPPSVLRELRTRVNDPNQFADQMAALSCWSMLRSRGLPAEIVEEEGLPDVRVAVGDPAQAHWIEAKRVRIGKRPEQVRRVIVYANKQIKRAGEGVGSVFLYIERPQQRVVFDDRTPSVVQAYLDEADRELKSGYSRSVAEVIVAWDDYMLLGSPPGRTSYFLRRRSVLLHHKAPRAPSLLPSNALELGRTVMLPIEWRAPVSASVQTPEIKVGSIKATELFRKECEVPGYVRTVHAIEALSNPDAIERYPFNGTIMILATRRITLAHEPYTLLVIAAERQVGELDIYAAFRVYDDPGSAVVDVRPLAVFEQFLKRYGMPVTVGNQSGLFIPAARIQAGGGDQPLVQGTAPQGEPYFVHAVMRADSAGFIDLAWVFAVLTGRYSADVRRHSR